MRMTPILVGREWPKAETELISAVSLEPILAPSAGLINAGKALGKCAVAAGDFAGMSFVFANVS